jgi:hypothetical protein
MAFAVEHRRNFLGEASVFVDEDGLSTTGSGITNLVDNAELSSELRPRQKRMHEERQYNKDF